LLLGYSVSKDDLDVTLEHQLQFELEQARIDLGACDDAVVPIADCRVRRVPDRVVRQVEELGPELDELRLRQGELLVDRGVEVDDAGADNRVTGRVAVAVARPDRAGVDESW